MQFFAAYESFEIFEEFNGKIAVAKSSVIYFSINLSKVEEGDRSGTESNKSPFAGEFIKTNKKSKISFEM